jgi:hypothetical protein
MMVRRELREGTMKGVRVIRSAIAGGAVVAMVAGLWIVTARRSASQVPSAPAAPAITVYKSPTCGCCTKWIRHLEHAGFTVTAHDVENVAPIKRQYGVPAALESCHTAVVGGYAVEGHVPADVIQRLLRERPNVAGIAVPGMPTGSPGMEYPDARPQPYAVMAYRADGGWSVYERR